MLKRLFAFKLLFIKANINDSAPLVNPFHRISSIAESPMEEGMLQTKKAAQK